MLAATEVRVLVTVGSGIYGLVFGSFLNVVIYRAPRGIALTHPRSRCPACGTPIAARDNLPVLSWLVLRGRCRACAAPISVRYPLVELVTGLALAGLALALPTYGPLAPLAAIAAVAVAAAGIDVDRLAVPWSLAVCGALGALGLVAVAAVDAEPGRIGWAAAGALACALADLATEYRRAPRWPRRVAVCAALGWAAGWLWVPGGFALAGWVLVSGAALRALEGREESADVGGEATSAGAPAGPRLASCRLLVVAIVAYGILIAGALAGRG